jgi:hypothetical protein
VTSLGEKKKSLMDISRVSEKAGAFTRQTKKISDIRDGIIFLIRAPPYCISICLPVHLLFVFHSDNSRFGKPEIFIKKSKKYTAAASPYFL